MLSSQTGQQEGNLGGLGVASETDESTSDGGFKSVAPQSPDRRAADSGVGVAALGRRESRGFGANLLDSLDAKLVVLLHSEEDLLKSDNTGIARSGRKGRVDGVVVESTEEVRDSPGKFKHRGVTR